MLNRTREQEVYQSKTAQKETHYKLLKIRLQVFLELLALKLQLIYLVPRSQTLNRKYFFYPINIFGRLSVIETFFLGYVFKGEACYKLIV
jgi:hypothetical protein